MQGSPSLGVQVQGSSVGVLAVTCSCLGRPRVCTHQGRKDTSSQGVGRVCTPSAAGELERPERAELRLWALAVPVGWASLQRLSRAGLVVGY